MVMMICQQLFKIMEVKIMCNMDLRQKAKEKGVFFWQIAAELGVSEPTMTRRLRFELPEQEKQKYLSIIDQLSSEKEAE
jgi:hypothetical protein